jgi:ubiquinol-cytochrome c reductase cytochrome c1 subunit
MKKIISICILLLAPVVVQASSEKSCGEIDCYKANIDLDNKASLQRGAKLFVNYCMGCHSAEFMSYERMAKDLGLDNEIVLKNLVFSNGKIGDYMTIAMPADDAKSWFGVPPPDLSLVARSRGIDWLYTYLKTFYADDSRPFGVNNLAFSDVGMPHALQALEGMKQAVYKTVKDEHSGDTTRVFESFETISQGSMSAAKFDQAVLDLVNFLEYTGEPAKLVRYSIGVKVILFLIILLIPAYLMKKEFWKDVH